MKKRLPVIAALLALVLTCSACAQNDPAGINEYATTVKNTQVFTEPEEAGSTAAQPSAGVSDSLLTANNSWMGNYSLTYTYTEGTESSQLREMRCAGLYSVTDLASGAATYFIQNGSDIDQYVLNPAAMSGTHSVLSDQSLADITTGFMKIAYVDSSFPTLSNVEYQGEETVAGRVAAKYTQSAYNTAGLLTAYAFVWIDSEYGFASKCRVYNMTGSVNVSWELTELTVGGVSEESIGFSTDGYTITEAQVTEPTAAES